MEYQRHANNRTGFSGGVIADAKGTHTHTDPGGDAAAVAPVGFFLFSSLFLRAWVPEPIG